MKLRIKIHANSSQEKIEKISLDFYEVWIKEKPLNNKANEEIVKILKKYFKRNVEIKSGFKGRNKIIEIETEI